MNSAASSSALPPISPTMPLSGNSAGIPSAHAQAGPVASPAPEKGPQYLKFPGKNEGLVVLGEKPLVAETPESLLDDDTTPIEKFYIRNNGQIPEETKNPDAWKITIDGEVNNKIEITLGELKSKYKAVTRRMQPPSTDPSNPKSKNASPDFGIAGPPQSARSDYLLLK